VIASERIHRNGRNKSRKKRMKERTCKSEQGISVSKENKKIELNLNVGLKQTAFFRVQSIF